jgi:hypothetical protein
VARRGGSAVHVVETAIPEDTVVHLKVDWIRRFDHMQQHSGILRGYSLHRLCSSEVKKCVGSTPILGNIHAFQLLFFLFQDNILLQQLLTKIMDTKHCHGM